MTTTDRRRTGSRNYHAGQSAESIVELHYTRQGCSMRARRWRGTAGEIDLVAQDASGLVFIEVKAARDFARAAQRLGRRQIQRLYAAGSEFLEQMPAGQNTDVRFDVALVDGTGRIEVLENAIMM